MKRKVVSFLSGSLFFCFSMSPAAAESILDSIQDTGILKVAIREDAAPLGYLNANNALQGYCLDFFAVLEQQLLEELERNTVTIKLFKSTARNRFSLVENSIVHLECGPNTIVESASSETDFSTAFFATGTQFLVNRENRGSIRLERDLNQIRVGVIKGTTTEEFVRKSYPLAIISLFSGATARNRGVQALSQGKIDAMASDGILLRAEAQKQRLSSSQYPLIPATPLTCDLYGMIIRGQDSQWKNFINRVIGSQRIQTLSRDWFGSWTIYEPGATKNCSLE